MAGKWFEYFVRVRDKNGGNIVTVAGAFVMLVSLALPWYYVEYRISTAGIEGLRLPLEFMAGKAAAPLLPAVAATFLALSALYILVSDRAKRALPLTIAAAILIAAAMFWLRIPPVRYGPGLYCAAVGLFAAAAGSLAKR